MNTNLEDRVLGWVNEVRADLGLRPRKRLLSGRPKDIAACPVARSLSTSNKSVEAVVWLGSTEIYDTRKSPKSRVQLILPSHVQRWIMLFDYGKLKGTEDDS